MNNKGITLIEIIISIVLISIVLIFLFSLLVTVKDINFKSDVNSTYLINKSLILKNIEEDFSKASSVHVEKCVAPEGKNFPINELYSNYGVADDYFKNSNGDEVKTWKRSKCMKFTYDTGDPGLLGIYYYKAKDSYVISYIRGNTKATRELPKFEKVNKNLSMKWEHNNVEIDDDYFNIEHNLTDGNFHNIYIPIIGSDGKDYSLNISYYKKTTP